MGRALGKNQYEIGLCLRGYRFEDKGLDARQLAQRIYKVDQPTQSQLNVSWAALKGMERRGLIIYTGTSPMGGMRQWVLTPEGRELFAPLKPKGKPPLKAVR